jgi:hypothetical protein
MGRLPRRPRQWRLVVSVVSDEVLMAYADGVLDPAERDAVEAAIQRHPECRQKVEKFRATLSPLQSLFRESIGIDHLDPLIDRIRRADLAPSQRPARPAEVRQLPQARPMRAPRHPWHQHYPMAIAASLALLIGAALGSLLQPRAALSVPTVGFIGVSDGRLTAQGPLQDLLEHTARGIPVRVELAGGGTWELEAAFSFRSIGQQSCRRYELTSMAQEHFAGFACRGGDGQWTVQAHAKLDSTPVNPGAGFTPASGPSADAADVALEAAIRAASGGTLYRDAEEKAALVAGWTR